MDFGITLWTGDRGLFVPRILGFVPRVILVAVPFVRVICHHAHTEELFRSTAYHDAFVTVLPGHEVE